MGDKKELVGIKGWLLFFLIIFILSAIGIPQSIFKISQTDAYVNLLNKMSPSVDLPTVPQPIISLKVVHIAFLVIALILLILTIIAILKKQVKTKKLAIFSTWIMFATGIVGALIPLTMITDIQKFYTALGLDMSIELVRSTIYSATFLSIIVGVIWPIIVTLYFIKSERAKNTLTN